MRHAVIEKPDGTFELVGADMKPLGKADADRRTLHILPRLWYPADDGWDRISLEVSSTLPDAVPASGIYVRRPYPNQSCLVGGSDNQRIGWCLPIAEDVDAFDITFRWSQFGCLPGNWTIEHQMHVKLLPGEGRTWSMDRTNWPFDFEGRHDIAVCPWVSENERLLSGRDIVKNEFGSDRQNGALTSHMLIEENLKIPGVALEQAWSIFEFQEPQLHEIEHREVIENGTEAHRANTLIEMPVELFHNAVRLAETEPFDVGGAAGALEQHPALKLLCEWWETVRPSDEPLKPGMVMPFVRVSDDNQYWCGYGEYPNEKVEGFNPGGRNCARVGDLILIQFQATQASAKFDQNGITYRLPNGVDLMTVGVDEEDYRSGKHDEAWYSLHALAGFRRHFPVAWNWVVEEWWFNKRAKVCSDGLLDEFGDRTDVDQIVIERRAGGIYLVGAISDPSYLSQCEGLFVWIRGTTGVKIREVFERYKSVAHLISPDNASAILWSEIANDLDDGEIPPSFVGTVRNFVYGRA